MGLVRELGQIIQSIVREPVDAAGDAAEDTEDPTVPVYPVKYQGLRCSIR